VKYFKKQTIKKMRELLSENERVKIDKYKTKFLQLLEICKYFFSFRREGKRYAEFASKRS
jgi:hypothetical protein